MTLPETRGLPTAETMDSEEGAELGIQNVAMDDIVLSDEKEKEKEAEKKVEAEKANEEKQDREKEEGKEKNGSGEEKGKQDDKKEPDDEKGKHENGEVAGSYPNLVDSTSF